MTNTTRRDFLRRIMIALGALTGGSFLGNCAPRETVSPPPTAVPPTARPTLSPTQAASPTSTTVPPSPTAAATATSTAAAKLSPEMVVVRGGEPEQLVRRAVAALGGIERFVKPGNDVIIKPNICVAYHTYEYAATTNPWVVATLVKMCREAGAKRVRVMDYPFGGSAEQAYIKSGIREQVEAASGEMELMAPFKYVSVDIPEAKDMKTASIYDDILKTDVVINVPIAKQHGLSKLTMGLKNLMGVVKNQERPGMHGNLGQRVPDLATKVKPALTILDAVRILTAHGPSGGNLADVKKLDTIVASTDIVAVDAYGTGLFGMKPRDLPYVTTAAAMGLGKSDLASLRIEEISLS